jgi:2-keto-4-pentenoate hydratase/2-oxohepta-3-ene-1,7-dioic acid hydratase in catechol pathway
MKYVRLIYNNETVYGSLEDDKVILLSGTIFGSYTKTDVIVPLSQAKLLSPCSPSKIVCVGVNYHEHAEECNVSLPESPVVFMKPSSCVIGPSEDIIYPPQSHRVDFEAELGVVIKKQAKNVQEADARDYILGFTCANDVTARDLQPSDGQWTIAKSFDTFLPLGPVITDEIDGNSLKIQSRLNGKVMQNSNTSNLIFKVDFLVSYLSKVMTLYPGDVLITGTPRGIAPMFPGDVIEVEIEKIGILKNYIK